MQAKSKDAFKKLVSGKAKEYALNKLNNKKLTHSKLEKLEYFELSTQCYLLSENLSVEDKKKRFLISNWVFRYTNTHPSENTIPITL